MYKYARTQPVDQLQHRRAASIRITPPAFIPQRKAEVHHVAVRWHLKMVSHHAPLMWCAALTHWGNFSVTANFPNLWQQSRAVAKRPRPEGPTLGWLRFLWCKNSERSEKIRHSQTSCGNITFKAERWNMNAWKQPLATVTYRFVLCKQVWHMNIIRRRSCRCGVKCVCVQVWSPW